jgi:CheY-like chemotaxis protein
MDISMPVMDGYEGTLVIRELEKRFLNDQSERAYIVGLTAHNTDKYKDKCFEVGMNNYSKHSHLLIII